ncbi:MAG: ATP-binding protein [Bacilli bacterium]|nr:ATP-binding protein [Bacilli bacterium]
MFDRIIYISDESANIKLKENQELTMNLMNLHLVFEDSNKKILGEVDDLDGDIVKARFLGEIVGDRLIGGTIRKPSLDAKIRVIDRSEIPLITGSDTDGYMKLGVSPFYDGFPVFLDVNNFFSNHFAIFGNTGSGKSCGTARLFQNMFHDQRLNPYKANIFILDSSGEYYNAFSNLNQINNTYNYRYISTNEVDGIGEKLRLPIYLLNKDDLALLLQCTSHSQLPIIERMLKLALVFSQNDMDANAYKNHLIAKAIMTILYTNETAPNKRNEIFSILASCSTDEFNLEAPVQGIGYVRKFRECFLIDNSGNFTESVLLTEYVNSFIKAEYDNYEPHTGVYYDLNTLERALNFTLISEGWLRNEQTYGDSVTIRVRLHSLIVGDNAKYFDFPDYVSLESYLSSLLITDGKKYQVVNINLSDIDDEFAKVLTKIYSRLIFDFAKALKNRGSIPFHIILEEAHRYIQSDHDRFLFGYNIFERIAKEGRKYGVILGIITQRPVELSDNVISQCTNFLIFKINHPMDIDYIRKTIPHITDDIIEKQKSLQSGTCLGFGLGFRIPLIIRMEMPNPSPLSGNCDVVSIWKGSHSAPVVSAASAPEISMGVTNNVVEATDNFGQDNSESFDDSFVVTVPTATSNAIPEMPVEPATEQAPVDLNYSEQQVNAAEQAPVDLNYTEQQVNAAEQAPVDLNYTEQQVNMAEQAPVDLNYSEQQVNAIGQNPVDLNYNSMPDVQATGGFDHVEEVPNQVFGQSAPVQSENSSMVSLNEFNPVTEIAPANSSPVPEIAQGSDADNLLLLDDDDEDSTEPDFS